MKSIILIFLIISLVKISFVLGDATVKPTTSTTTEKDAGGDAAAPCEDLGGESSTLRIEPNVGIFIATVFCSMVLQIMHF